MKKLLLLAMVVGLVGMLVGCSHTAYIRNHPDRLKPGLNASAFLEVWGEPDETMAFQDYRAQGYYYHSGTTGSWGPYGGSVSGYGFGTTYTPTTIVWIYKEKNKALFFQQRGLLGEQYKYSAITIMSWKLIGWENIKPSDDKTNARMKYAERRINEVGITSDSDIRIFWAVMEKAPKEITFEDQVEWAIKRTQEIMSNSEKK
jgi:hypothetical protein